MAEKKKNKTLHVQEGVERPDTIHPEALEKLRKSRKRLLKPEEYITGILAGDRTLLSQAITIIESSLPEHLELAREIIRGCLPHSGNSIRIGITGVPGVGKSSFIESLGTRITASGKRLAVLAMILQVNDPGVAFWAIKHGWKICRPIRMPSSGLPLQGDPWEELPEKPGKQ